MSEEEEVSPSLEAKRRRYREWHARNLKKISDRRKLKNITNEGGHRDKSIARDKKHRGRMKDLGLCECGNKPSDGFKSCDDCLESGRAYNRRLKIEVLTEYGGKCQCPGCGIDILDFLTIDHISGNGAEHRKELGTRGSLYKWLRKNGYPRENFQILCMNCNFAKGKNKICPHLLMGTKGNR